MANMASEMLYVIKRTRAETKDPGGEREKVDLFGTYTNLMAAKKAARVVLEEEGYEKEWFQSFYVNNGSEDWDYGDGVIVYATTLEGGVFKVEIETDVNTLSLLGDFRGRITQTLYHVLETMIRYDIDRSGGTRVTRIEGIFTTFEDARRVAFTILLDEATHKSDFAEYDEFEGQEEWGFGEDVVVHAVGMGGENFLVSIVKN